MIEIHRYDGLEVIVTKLDPLEDAVTWLSGLRSKGYVSDVLVTKHHFGDRDQIDKYTKLIATYAVDAVGLIQQAHGGPPEVSFLPLYYALLNLSNIYIALSDNRAELLNQRSHGASYNRTRPMVALLEDQVEVHPSGTLALFDKTLTGEPLVQQTISLGDMYPFIHWISHEYMYATKLQSPLRQTRLRVKGDSANGFYVECELSGSDHPKANDLPSNKLLDGFNRADTIGKIWASAKVVAATEELAAVTLKQQIKRYLLYDPDMSLPSPTTGRTSVYCSTPISDAALLLPEELPIWIALFHLSNIVRYRPENIPELQDSSYWAMLLALRRHAILRFLLLFWSNFHQSDFIFGIQ